MLLYNKDFLPEHFDIYEDEDEDSEDEEEKLEDLTCDALKKRLRALNKPVSGRKAELISHQALREHEKLTEALSSLEE